MRSDSQNRLIATCVVLLILCGLIPQNLDAQTTLSCHETVNVSLNENCISEVDHTDLLSTNYPGVSFTLELKDDDGFIIFDNTLRSYHLGTEVTGKVIQTSNGNSCWSTIVVEDKMAPTLICDDYIVDCFDDQNYEPIHFDNCGASEINILHQEHNTVACNGMIAKEFITVYEAVDNLGNKSAPCQQTISIEHVNLDLIEFPPSYELINSTNLICTDSQFDENGYPLYEFTGVPMYETHPLNPGDDACSLHIEYEDLLLNNGGCFKKYMRTWTIYQEVCGVFRSRSEAQVIEFADTEDPEIVCPDARTVNTDGTPGCDALVQLELAEYSDDCSEVIEMDIVTPAGFYNNVTEAPEVNLNAGVNEIEYTVYDACERFSTCVTTITVLDNTEPVARCDKSSVVSLRSDGTALALTQTFDEGTFDDCNLYKTFIKRLDDTCGCPLPTYNDMDYVGEYNGHFYYISNIERYGFEAFEYSKAMGGQIVVTESLAEHTWLNDKIREDIDAPFLIGLKDKDGSGVFKWPNHSTSSLDLWATGFPYEGHYVVVNEDGEWETADANIDRFYFVLELTTPCTFSDRVYFCCEDAGQDVPMVLRAVDRAGRYNDCEFTTEVQDKVAPNIECPNSIVLDCSTDVDLNNLDIYGTATATDQCLVVIDSEYDADVNACGIGEIIRTFTASDANGSSTCQQTISLEMLGNPVEQDIDWPDDYSSNVGCLEGDIMPENLPAEFAFPDFQNTDCSILIATFSDQVYSFAGQGDDACFKVLRTWKVEDECRWGEPGYEPLEYQQTLKIGNVVPPTIDLGCADITVSTSDCDEANVDFVIVASDDCTAAENLGGSLQVDIDSDGGGSFDLNYNHIDAEHQFDEILPVGEHFALISYNDQCGNPMTCTKRITVESTKGPSAKCVPGLVTTVQEMDLDGDNNPDTVMVVLIPENLDAGNPSLGTEGSSHDCGFDFGLSFSADPDDQMHVFDCDDVGGMHELELWVTDEFGNTSVCTTIVEVNDPQDRCSSGRTVTYNIDGHIYTENLQSIEGVELQLAGMDYPSVQTNADGQYAFATLLAGIETQVSPRKTDGVLDGVSTLDILKIQRHILGLEKIESSYKLIAADVDNSGSISASDLLEIRRLILGKQELFNNTDSWRMIDRDQKFNNPDNPFEDTWRQAYFINDLSSDMTIDFIGVKTGDVDDSNSIATGSQIDSRSVLKAVLETENKQMVAGNIYELNFDLKDINSISGMQFEMTIDDRITILDVTSSRFSISEQNYNKLDGNLRFSWNSNEAILLDQNSTFTITVQANESVFVNDCVQMNSEGLHSEVYTDSDVAPLQLSFRNSELDNEILLYQNAPNPWSDFTEVKFYIDRIKPYTFSVFDINGRLLHRQQNHSKVGINKVLLDKYDINADGILYYELQIDGQRYMNKMIVIK